MAKVKIIGAGLFGCCIAEELVSAGHEVIVYEQEDRILQRASKINHNRIHFGYHYPRSLETAKQSLQGLLTFYTKLEKEVIFDNFDNYYMIAKEGSNVDAVEYLNFCDDAGIQYDEVWPEDCPKGGKIVDRDKIALSVKVKEPVIDVDWLYTCMEDYMKDVDVRLNTPFDGKIDDCDYVINCSYSNINKINKSLGVDELNLKFQEVIIPEFFLRDFKRDLGVTIMDGPFYSLLPKGNGWGYMLYSPNESVLKQSKKNIFIDRAFVRKEDVKAVHEAASEYMPFLKNYDLGVQAQRVIRALPINNNDARLSEIFVDQNNPNFISILSGKLSTCFKVAIEVRHIIENGYYKEIIA